MDDQIPLSEPIKLRNGQIVDSVPVKKGNKFFIPIHSFNRSEALWGPDAGRFDPDRWLRKDQAGGGAGVYAGMLTFLAGPRGCIGYRFALAEFKVIVAAVIVKFAFAERDEGGGPAIEKTSSIVSLPTSMTGKDADGHAPKGHETADQGREGEGNDHAAASLADIILSRRLMHLYILSSLSSPFAPHATTEQLVMGWFNNAPQTGVAASPA